jgi:hypothetical protein
MLLNFPVEAVGYIARTLSTKHTSNRNIFIVQFCLIVLSPVLMAAACYIIFVSRSY